MTGYREIARRLAERIASGHAQPGTALPRERDLAAEFGAARGTVRAALASLAASGMVTPRQGSGWIVQSTRQTHGFSQLRSFAQWAASKGMRPGGRVVEMRRDLATAGEARRLRAATGSPVLRVTRLRSLDDRDVMLERTVYAEWMIEIIESIDDEESSVVRAMEAQHGVVTAHAEHSIDAVAASSEDARLLGIRRSGALLRVRRVSFARDGRAIEVGDDRYLPGTVSFQVSASMASSTLTRAVG